MKRRAGFLSVVVLGAAVLVAMMTPPLRAQQPAIPWGGYVQARFTQSNDETGFSIRRAKLWLNGAAPVGRGLYYKLQGLFRATNGGALTLQDAYLEYRTRLGFLRAGQMVPDFSLERSQPDAEIPLSERAAVINTLIPSATTGARDIGLEAALGPGGTNWHATVGVFNGNGGNASQNEDRHFLLTGRATYAFPLGGGVSWEMGSSVAWRRTDGLAFQSILETTTPFSGDDVRWGVESRWAGRGWELQGEYLHTTLGDSTASGYYALGEHDVGSDYQLAASVERLAVPDPQTRDDPWYIVGASRLIAGQRAKLMLDVRVQPGEPSTACAGRVQWQLMFR